VHLWFDRPVMSEPFLTLLDHTTQWIFNKSLLCGGERDANGSGFYAAEETERKSQYLQLVISASYGLVPRSRQEIIDLCLRELGEVLPATRRAQLMKGTVIKEVNATFSPGPGIDRWRPRAGESGIENLFLAGDWTRTGWPATMEGAVRSGYLAAESLLSHFGQPRNFLRADLPLEGLCKKWAERKALK
jgi:zeta-carotene desaturase